jgi:cholesterol transport system auxiliary component
VSSLRACAVGLALAFAANGCSIVPPRAAPPLRHDFGPLPPVAVASDRAAPRRALTVGEVSAPTWLDSDAIRYRLLYAEPTLVRRYGVNRWLAQPADLVKLRLQAILAAKDATSDRARLDLRLIRFEQVFDSPHRASAVIEVTARLRSHGDVLAETEFKSVVHCTPNVDGAVDGLARAATVAMERVRDWAYRVLSARAALNPIVPAARLPPGPRDPARSRISAAAP